MPDVERRYYVICEYNCKFESMTKEQIIAAIEEATGNVPTHIDDAFITKLKEINKKRCCQVLGRHTRRIQRLADETN